jgi:hypothetical protein
MAAHNDREVVVASDALSTSTRIGVQAVDDSIQKVHHINSRLVLAITGSYMSDKLSFFSGYASLVSGETELDTALDKLFDMAAATMRIHQGEGFRMSLIGFNANEPGFKCVDVEKGKGYTALGESELNYWVSGEYDPVEHARHMIEQSNISANPATAKIETILRSIVTDCIERYPRTLGKPVNVLVLR